MQLIHIEPQTSGEAGGITSSLRCETAAWRKPEEDKPSFALAACCLLSTAASTTWLPGLLTPEEMTLNRLNSNQARLLYSNMLCIVRKLINLLQCSVMVHIYTVFISIIQNKRTADIIFQISSRAGLNQ